MAYNDQGYYPYQDLRAYPQDSQQQYQPQGQNPPYSPQRIEVQIPKISQYDGTTSSNPIQDYPTGQYQQVYAQPKQEQHQHQSKTAKLPPTPSSTKSIKKGSTESPKKAHSKQAKSTTSKVKAEPREIDYAQLLIDLAEDYFSAAYTEDSKTAVSRKESDYEQFCKLIATGLGCLEVVLKQWRSALQPSLEAAVRLRYASVLFQETENFMEAEEALSKGIWQCEKYKLQNSKYNMYYLLSRISCVTNPKAAMKFLDTALKHAEAEQHRAWLYALRFLRVSFSFDMNQPQETLAAFNQLKIIINTANFRRDTAVTATAYVIEALGHVGRSITAESIEQAQTALASARSLQMSSDTAQIPNLTVMTHFIDLICTLSRDEYELAVKKMKIMHVSLEELRDSKGWSFDGVFTVPVPQQSSRGGVSTQGVVLTDSAGFSSIQLKWLSKDEVYTLGYMLSAAVTMAKNPQDRMTEKFLKEALVQLGPEAPIEAGSKQGWYRPLHCQIQVSLVFALCGRSAWSEAKKELAALKEMAAQSESSLNSPMEAFILYLDGMICQGTGDTSGALSIYSNPLLAIDRDPPSNRPTIIRDLSILAALNTILIIHLPNHPQHSRLSSILSSLEGLNQTTQSRNIHAAYCLILSIAANGDQQVLKTKEYLAKVLTESKVTANNQLMSIAFTFMTENFFRGLKGDQSLKSARTAVNVARRQKNDLWTSVADGLLAESLETQGMGAEAEQVTEEVRQIVGRLPGVMQVNGSEATRGGWKGG